MRPTSKRPRALGAWLLRATAYARIGRRMPTKTRSWSRISREATAIINSCGVYDSLVICIIRGRRWSASLHAQRLDVDLFQVRSSVRHVEDPSLEPLRKSFRGSRSRRVVSIKGVIALEVALHRRRMGAARFMHNRSHLGLRKQDAVRVAQRHALVN